MCEPVDGSKARLYVVLGAAADDGIEEILSVLLDDIDRALGSDGSA